MNSKRTETRRGPGRGVLVLADLTGYSGYLRDSELAHAQETLASLLELLVDGTRPPLTVSKLEGDAVLSYGWDDQIQGGQAFAEMIEAIYVAFRRALNQMVLNTTCECNACANISLLDLKFFVHHGDFAIVSVAGYDELQGSDVNVVHRLLKNEVTASTGVQAYALYTDAAIVALGLDGLTSSMIPHIESVADVGDVSVWVLDLAPLWETWRDRSSFEIDESEYLLTLETRIPLSAEVVWAYMLGTEYRSALIGSDRQVIEGAKNGRVSEDTVYVCYHGDRVLTQVVLEIVPFERLLYETLCPCRVTPPMRCWSLSSSGPTTGFGCSNGSLDQKDLGGADWPGGSRCVSFIGSSNETSIVLVNSFWRQRKSEQASQ